MADIDETIRSYIGSKYNTVGVKILKTEADPKERPDKPLRYCEMLYLAATKGEEFTFQQDDLSCPNAELALGFVEPKYVDVQPRISPGDIKAVRIGPAKGMKDVDVILVIANPKQLMDLSVLLGGIEANFRGEIAVCGEATAFPYMTKKPNVTFLCNGARTFSPYKDSELVLGLPYEGAKELAEKIQALTKCGGALCGCLTSDTPKQIIAVFSKIGFEKGTDYFFGKIKDYNVRLYLNKDEQGRIKWLTVYVPMKGEVKPKKPFSVRTRGQWSDVFAIFDPNELGINLYSDEGLREVLEKLMDNMLEK